MFRTKQIFSLDSFDLSHTSGTNVWKLNLAQELDLTYSTNLYVGVLSYSFTNTWNAVRSTNKAISVTEYNNSDLVPWTYTVNLTEGNYTSSTFATMLKSVLETASIASGYSRTYTVSISSTTGKLSIINASSKKTDLDFNVSNSAYLLCGFLQSTYNLNSGNSYTQTSPGVVDLTGSINFLRVQCPSLISAGVITSRNGAQTSVLLSAIVTSGFLDIQTESFSSPMMLPMSSNRKDIRTIEFQLFTESGEAMDETLVQNWTLQFGIFSIN